MRRLRRWSRNPVNKDVLRALPKLQDLESDRSEEIIDIVDAIDPTPTGYYAHWVLRDVIAGKIQEEDIPKVRGWMEDYLELGQANKAIRQDYPLSKKGIKDSTQLFQFLQDKLPDKYSLEMIPHQGGSRGGSKLAGVTEYGGIPYPFRILKVEGDNRTARRSLMKLGKGTAWCTTNYESAKHYLAENPVIIILAFHKPYVQAHIGLEHGLQIKNVEDENMDEWAVWASRPRHIDDEILVLDGPNEAPKSAADLDDPNKEEITGLLERIKFFRRAYNFYEKKLTSSSTEVVVYATEGLGQLGDSAALPPLINLLRIKYWKKLITAPPQDPREQAQGWQLLHESKTKRDFGPAFDIMRAAISAIEKIGDRSAIPALKEVLSPELGAFVLPRSRPPRGLSVAKKRTFRKNLPGVIRTIREDSLSSIIHLGSTREEFLEILPTILKMLKETKIAVSRILSGILEEKEHEEEREEEDPDGYTAPNLELYQSVEWGLKNDPTVIPILIDKLNQEALAVVARARAQAKKRSKTISRSASRDAWRKHRRRVRLTRLMGSIIYILGALKNTSAIPALLETLPMGPGPLPEEGRTWRVTDALTKICSNQDVTSNVCQKVVQYLNRSLRLIYTEGEFSSPDWDSAEVRTEALTDIADSLIHSLGELKNQSSIPAILYALKRSKAKILAHVRKHPSHQAEETDRLLRDRLGLLDPRRGRTLLISQADPNTGEPLVTPRMLTSQMVLEMTIADALGNIGDSSLIPVIYSILAAPMPVLWDPLKEAYVKALRGEVDVYIDKQLSCIHALEKIGGPGAAQALNKFIDNQADDLRVIDPRVLREIHRAPRKASWLAALDAIEKIAGAPYLRV